MELGDYLDRIVVDDSGCWIYPNSLNPKGYGRIRGTLSHRFFWEELVGELTSDLDHLCRNASCVNLDHLEPVTNAENQARRWADYDTCVNGHAYTPENTITKANGTRNCRECHRQMSRRYRQRRKGAPLAPVGRPRTRV